MVDLPHRLPPNQVILSKGEPMDYTTLISEPPPHPEREDHFKLGDTRMNFPCVICIHGDSPLVHKDCETCRHYWR